MDSPLCEIGGVVSRLLAAWALALLIAALHATPARAGDDAALSKELTAVIDTKHLPCGQIVHISTQSDRDYLISCKDGSNYQIVADSQGQLAAHPLGQKKH
jgi:hypothetical protein